MSRINNNSTVTTSFPIASILTIVFVVLKLTNVISWSWWWVLSPLWIPLGLIFVLFVVIFIFLFVETLVGLR